jgi:hypothetical protein
MQNTRLSTLFDTLTNALGGWLRNPWRRLSVLIISLLFGNFLASAISTIAGQKAELDIVAAVFLVAGTELISRLAYSGNTELGRSLLVQLLNMIKIGMIYGLFVEAFKLGS